VSERVVVITGASSGIGAALAERLGRGGAAVVLVARRKDALQAVAGRCGERALAIAGDMTDRSEVQRVMDEAISRLGRIDVLVNNAGRGISRPPSQLTDDDIDEMMRINVKAALYGIQAVLPHFKARGTGHIINVSSLLGRMPFAPYRSAYNGAKHFLNALTSNLRDELRESHPGIHVSLVSPGVVRTDFWRHSLHGGPDTRDLPFSQSAEEVAPVIAELIESPRPDIYTRAGARERVTKYFGEVGEDP